MKKFIIICSLLALVAIPFRPAEASVEDASIRRVVVLSTLAACAFNVQILTIINNQINGSEALLINGIVFATLALLVGLVTIQSGDFILFASPAFEAEAGIQADVPITDQQCENLQDTDEVSFLGSQGNIVSQVFFLTGLAVLTAIVFSVVTGAYDAFSMLTFFVTINNLLGNQVTVGNANGTNAEDQGSGGGGGCGLFRLADSTSNSSGNSGWGFLLGFLSLGGLGLCVRRRLV